MHMHPQFLIKTRKPLYRGSLNSIRIGSTLPKSLKSHMCIPVNEKLEPLHDQQRSYFRIKKVKQHMHTCFSRTNPKPGNPFIRGSLNRHQNVHISSKSLANFQNSISICTARTSNLQQIRFKSAKPGSAFLFLPSKSAILDPSLLRSVLPSKTASSPELNNPRAHPNMKNLIPT